MSEEPLRTGKPLTPAASDPSGDEPWRTMAGLLGRAWLARNDPARSGGIAVVGQGIQERPVLPLGAAGALAPLSRGPTPLSMPLARPGGRTPVGGVASFVAEVASAHAPTSAEHLARERPLWGREHRGIHCHVGPHLHVSHPPCNRPPE
jgi:hypothetical protein